MILFFFKQKTAYEMRISDWSSDVCSSDLLRDRWSEQIGPGDTPQNLTLGAGGDPRTEKRSGGSVDCAIAAAGYFMQRAEGEPFAWQTRVHRGHPEGENRFGPPAAAFDLFALPAPRLYTGPGPPDPR